MTDLNYAQAVPGRDPVHTYAARELLLDALAAYDGGCYPSPMYVVRREDGSCEVVSRQARKVAHQALLDATVLHDLEPAYHDEGDDMSLDDMVSAHEYAVELLYERLRTNGKRRPAVAL